MIVVRVTSPVESANQVIGITTASRRQVIITLCEIKMLDMEGRNESPFVYQGMTQDDGTHLLCR